MGRCLDGLRRAFHRQVFCFADAVAALLRRLTGVDLTRCPVGRQARLQLVAAIRPGARPDARDIP